MNERPFVYLSLSVGAEPLGKLVFEFFSDITPKTAENFRALCTGEMGLTKNGVALHYKKSKLHRLIPGFIAQGGDFTQGNGKGGVSIYGEKFPDENFRIKHDRRGLLSMANSGPDTNGSQFFVTFAPAPHLNNKHVVFGKLIQGFDILDLLEQVPVAGNDKPKQEITIVDCGEVKSAHIVMAADVGHENKTFLSEVQLNMDIASSKQLDAKKKMEKQSGMLKFPVPTSFNPSAVFVDEEARLLLEEQSVSRLNVGETAAKEFENKRKQKLIELRSKMAHGRISNQKEVVEEHRRFLDKGRERRSRQEEYELEEQRKLDEIKLKGGSKDSIHLIQTVDKALSNTENRRRKQKREAASLDRAGLYNQEAAYQAYKKRVTDAIRLESDSLAETVDVFKPAETSLQAHGTVHGISNSSKSDNVQRMVKELEVTTKRKEAMKLKSKGKDIEGRYVDGVNKPNEAWNKRLSRAYDKYTVEIRQNLERGSAM